MYVNSVIHHTRLYCLQEMLKGAGVHYARGMNVKMPLCCIPHFTIMFRFYTQLHHHHDCQSSWTTWPLKMGPKGCSEMLVQNYHSTLRTIPEEHVSHLHHIRSLKLLIAHVLLTTETLFKNSKLWCVCILFISSSRYYHRYIMLHGYVLCIYFIIYTNFSLHF